MSRPYWRLADDPLLAQDLEVVSGPADEVVAVHEEDYHREDEGDNEVFVREHSHELFFMSARFCGLFRLLLLRLLLYFFFHGRKVIIYCVSLKNF